MRVGPGSAVYVDPAPHELWMHLVFTEHNLSPYFALHSVMSGRDDYGEPLELEFELAGECWSADLKPKGSGFGVPEDPDFRFDLESVKEYVMTARPANPSGGADERKAAFTVSPRWPDMVKKDGSPARMPDITGVNVRVKGSNLEPDEYPVVLREAMDAFGVRPVYFEEIHPTSTIQRFELNVRILREKSKAVFGRGETIERIDELVGTEGGEYSDKTRDDRKVEGHYHQSTFDTGGAAALLEGHVLGKMIKHYHPKHPRSPDSDDPLAHPKLTVCYLQKKKNRQLTDGSAAPWLTDGGSVRWHERDKLERELDETVINALGWSGLPTRADRSVYVEDAHFSVSESERELEVVDDPLPEIRRTQRETVVPGLSGNPDLNQSDMDVVQVMTDGGPNPEMRLEELAAKAEISPRTGRRSASERLEELFDVDNGYVRFTSSYVRDLVKDLLSDIREAAETEDDAADDGGVWARFLNRYGVEVVDRDDARLELRIGTLRGKDPRDVLADARGAWLRAGRDLARFRNGLLRVPDEGGSGYYDGFR